MLKRFVSICTTLLRQLLRPGLGKSLGISTPTSQQVQLDILVEKREEFLTVGYVEIMSVSHTKFVQFVQNQNSAKTHLVFPTKDRNAEILSGGFNDHSIGY